MARENSILFTNVSFTTRFTPINDFVCFCQLLTMILSLECYFTLCDVSGVPYTPTCFFFGQKLRKFV